MKIVGYREEYKCGCISPIVTRKKLLLGYCQDHGDSRCTIYIEWGQCCKKEKKVANSETKKRENLDDQRAALATLLRTFAVYWPGGSTPSSVARAAFSKRIKALRAKIRRLEKDGAKLTTDGESQAICP